MPLHSRANSTGPSPSWASSTWWPPTTTAGWTVPSTARVVSSPARCWKLSPTRPGTSCRWCGCRLYFTWDARSLRNMFLVKVSGVCTALWTLTAVPKERYLRRYLLVCSQVLLYVGCLVLCVCCCVAVVSCQAWRLWQIPTSLGGGPWWRI